MTNLITCTGPECDRIVTTYTRTGLCNPHYLQKSRGKPLKKLRGRNGAVCKFLDCGRKPKAHNMCDAHYLQDRAGRELKRRNRSRGRVLARDEAGRKQCGDCREWKPESEYGSHAGLVDGLSNHCRACYALRYDPEAVRVRRLMSHYKLTLEEYDAMVAAQGDACATCGTTDRGDKSWHVDHDHACCPGNKSCGQCVRGLLCSRCNQALGMIRDDVPTLAAMIDYLSPTRTRSAR